MAQRLCILIVCAAFLLAGCTDNPTPDVHPEVFKTVGEVAVERREKYQRSWEQAAVALLRSDRPDILAMPLGDNRFGITLQADGVSRDVDLGPHLRALAAQAGETDTLLRQFLRPELVQFDQERLASLDFDQVKHRIVPALMGENELHQRAAELQLDSLPQSTSVAPGLVWLPVMEWTRGSAETSIIPPQALSRWHVSAEQVRTLALANLKADFRRDCFETTQFELVGKVGTLKAGVNPAILLLPEFVDAVRQAWSTSDDLAILAANRRNIRFVESHDRRLLDLLYPDWEHMVEDSPDPLCGKVLLASDSGLGLMDYNPPVRLHVAASQPVRPGMQRPGMVRPFSQRPTFQRPGPTSRPIIGR